MVEEWISVGTFRAKEKITATIGGLPKKPAADHQEEKTRPPK
jgi:hypothetical protein